jgi:hypothetical protein
MRRLVVTSALLCLTLAAASAHAGRYFEHETVTPNPVTGKPVKALVRTWQDGNRVKRENPMRNEVVIVDLDKHEVTGINASQKTWWHIPSDRYRQVAVLSLLVMGVQPRPDGTLDVPDGLFQPTGERAVIEGRKAWEVRVVGKLPTGVTTSIWLSDEVPMTSRDLVAELRLALSDPKGKDYDALFAQLLKLKGYPVQNVTSARTPQGMVTSSETLLKVKDQPIDPREFTVPTGYTQVTDPLTEMEAKEAAAQAGPVGLGAPLSPAR